MSKFSFVTTPVEALSVTGSAIGQGTAFFYKRDATCLYLVTAWHVVTDRKPDNPRKLGLGPVPVTLRLRLHKNVGSDQFRLSQKVTFDVPINDSEGENPTWFEHPDFGCKCDVVVLRIPVATALVDVATFAFLDEEDLQRDLVIEPMQDAFVIGYPWGLNSGDGVMPLYKRGSISSDPRLDYGALPRLLIDCRTSSGMSGAPVLASHSGMWLPSGELDDQTVFGTVTNFVGVYSGRLIGSSDNDRMTQEISELGIVWKKSALDLIVEKGRPGTKFSSL